MGYVFFEDTREQWRRLDWLPDYVLINSPAGINDLTGICTRQLPDLVVALAEADGTDQNGLPLVCADIRAEAKQGDRDIGLARVLVSVPNLSDELPRQLKQSAAEALGWDGVDALIHRDDRPFPREKRPVVLSHPRSRLAREYRRLTRVCMKKNYKNDRDGAQMLQKEQELDGLSRGTVSPRTLETQND
jgi:hypothetical protein